MIKKRDTNFDITLADPTHFEKKIVVGIAGNKKSKLIDARYDAGKDMTLITIKLPQGAEAGKSVGLTVE